MNIILEPFVNPEIILEIFKIYTCKLYVYI